MAVARAITFGSFLRTKPTTPVDASRRDSKRSMPTFTAVPGEPKEWHEIELEDRSKDADIASDTLLLVLRDALCYPRDVANLLLGRQKCCSLIC